MLKPVPQKEKWALLRQAFKGQLFPSFLIFSGALIFLGVAASGAYIAWHGTRSGLILTLLFGAAGLISLYFSAESLISSTRYYYESGLNKKYGRYFSAAVTTTDKEEIADTRQVNGRRKVTEILTTLYIGTEYGGQSLTAEYRVPQGKAYLADRLQPGMIISFRMVPGMPETVRVASGRLTRQLEALH